MGTVLLILLVVGFALAVLFGAGALFLQGYIYQEPAPGLLWRAPAAAAGVTMFLALWCLLNYRSPDRAELPYNTLFEFTGSDKWGDPVRELWAVKDNGKTRTRYVLKTTTGVPPRHEYRDPDRNAVWSSTSVRTLEGVVILEGEGNERHEVLFKADPTAGRYVEEGGRRYITEDQLGRVITPGRGGLTAVMLLLHVLFLTVLFACLWLLLRFQWVHALGLAAAFWFIMILFLLPMVFSRIKNVPRAAAVVPLTTPIS